MDRDTLAQLMAAAPQGQPGNVQMAANDVPPMTPQQMQIRLNQMLYDRRLSGKMGVPVLSDTYAPNAEIDRLRQALKGQG